VARRRDRRLLLLAAPFAALVLLETVIYRYGLFGSGGNADYLLPVAALAAITAALGADWLVAAVRVRGVRGSPAAAAALTTLLAAGTGAYALRTNPAHADQAARPIRAAVDYLDARHLDPGHATATHVWFWALSGAAIPGGDGIHSPWSRPPKPRHLPMHSIVVWDCFYSNRFGLKWRALTAAGFKQLAGFGGSRVVVLERTRARGRARARPPCRA
jgi:hypothetical protein